MKTQRIRQGAAGTAIALSLLPSIAAGQHGGYCETDGALDHDWWHAYEMQRGAVAATLERAGVDAKAGTLTFQREGGTLLFQAKGFVLPDSVRAEIATLLDGAESPRVSRLGWGFDFDAPPVPLEPLATEWCAPRLENVSDVVKAMQRVASDLSDSRWAGQTVSLDAWLLIDARGEVASLTIWSRGKRELIEEERELAEYIEAGLMASEWEPATVNGIPYPSWASQPISFVVEG